MAEVVFGRYEIIRRLAIGGMGEIFLARQSGIPGFERLAILKRLLPDLVESEEAVQRFLDEARVAATLNHPNIVAIYEVGAWEGQYYIAMEYIHGPSLAVVLRELNKAKTYIPPMVAARIIRDVAVALDCAHFAKDGSGTPLNIVHRDVSPQNIMVRADGITKVLDFGIAKAAMRASRTSTGEIRGKLRYMSPEQITGKPLDHRSDQFSLGVVFWELCARRRLFSDDDPVRTLREVLRSTIPMLPQVIPGFPVELDAIAQKMLQRDPEQRFARCLEVATAIEGYMSMLSQPVPDARVAEFLRNAVGEAFVAPIVEATPSRSNFNIQFRSSTGEQLGTALARRKKRRLLAAVGAVIASVAGIALTVALWPGTSSSGATSDAAVAVAAATDAAIAPASQPQPVLSVRSDPAGAAVLAGSQLLGTTPVDLDMLRPGVKHTLTVDKRGFQPQELAVELKPGERRTVEVALKRATASGTTPGEKRPPTGAAPTTPAATGPGTLSLVTTPWTEVTIDGAPYGSTPLFKIKLEAGEHKVQLVNKQAGVDSARKVTIKAGENTKLEFDLRGGAK